MNEKKNDVAGLRSGCSYEMMKLSEIVIREDFSSLFLIQEPVLKKITNSMLENGYDRSQPVTLWEYEKKLILVDGHTRVKAAERAGLNEIPVMIMHFNSIEDAKHYAFARQSQRRNLTQKEIFLAAVNIFEKESRDGSGRSVEKLSKEIGVSASTLVHAKTVANRGSEKDINAIVNGKATINSIYQKIKNKNTIKKSVVNNNPCKENVSKDSHKILKPKKSSKTKSVNINDILKLLKEHNEKNAIKVILEKYKNLDIQYS